MAVNDAQMRIESRGLPIVTEDDAEASLDATSSTRHCALLSLPAELRNRIYEYTLISDSYIDIYLLEKDAGQQPALTLTCRQIRNECLSLFYNRNKFRVRVMGFAPRDAFELDAGLEPLGIRLQDVDIVRLKFCGHPHHFYLKMGDSLANVRLNLIKTGYYPAKIAPPAWCLFVLWTRSETRALVKELIKKYGSATIVTESMVLEIMQTIVERCPLIQC